MPLAPPARMTEVQERRAIEEEWLWGWDPTPGIVSVWADGTGQATVWRRIPETGALVRETDRYEPWVLLDTLEDLRHLGNALAREGVDDLSRARVIYRALEGPGELRYLVRAQDGRTLTSAILDGASRSFFPGG